MGKNLKHEPSILIHPLEPGQGTPKQTILETTSGFSFNSLAVDSLTLAYYRLFLFLVMDRDILLMRYWMTG